MVALYTFANQGGQLVSAAELDANFAALAAILPTGSATGAVGQYTATGGETNITMAFSVAASWAVEVFRNGVRQIPNVDYSVSASTITLLSGAAVAGDSFWYLNSGTTIAPAGDFALLNLSNVPPAVLYTAGAYPITANTTISGDIFLLSGAAFSISGGVTLTINGTITAPNNRIFSGGGNVIIARNRNAFVRAEWWGALADGTTTGNETAFNAAFVAHGTVCALDGTYLISGPIIMGGSYPALLGNGNSATVFQSSSTSADIIQCGNYGAYGYTQFPIIRDLATTRSTAAVSPGGADRTGACGIRVNGVVRGEVSRTTHYESFIGVYINDTGACTFDNVLVARNAGSTRAKAYGFYVDGEVAGHLGFSSPNASLMMARAQVSMPADITTTYGFFCKGAVSDLFLDGAETGGCLTGIHIEGDASLTGVIDIHLQRPIVDAIRDGGTGIYVTNTGVEGAISIVGGYTSVASGSGTTKNIDIYSATGVSVSCHQIINATGATADVGLSIRSSNNVIATANQFKGSSFSVSMSSSYFCSVSNNAFVRRSAQASTAWWVNVIGGSNNAFLGNTGWSDAAGAKVTTAVNIDGTASACVIDVSGFRAVSVTQKLQINSATISSVGASGTHYVTGTFS